MVDIAKLPNIKIMYSAPITQFLLKNCFNPRCPAENHKIDGRRRIAETRHALPLLRPDKAFFQKLQFFYGRRRPINYFLSHVRP
jgi:hypothetical protein